MAGEVPPINITISADATNVAETLAAVRQEAQETFERAYVSAVQKAEQKLTDLTGKQREHITVIEANKTKIQELEQARQQAAETERGRIDTQISKYLSLNGSLQQNILKLEEKKVAQERLIDVTRAQGDLEKLFANNAAAAANAEIGILRSQLKAQQSVKEAVVDTEAVKARAMEATAAANAEAQRQIGEYTREQDRLQAVIAKHRQAIEQRTQATEKGSVEERKFATEANNDSRKWIENNTKEIALLEIKKIKLEELMLLSKAASDTEKQSIRAATDARIADIQATIQQSKAMKENTGTGNDSGDMWKSLTNRLSAAVIVYKLVQEAITQVNNAMRSMIETQQDQNEALKSFLDMQAKLHGGFKDLYSEFDITGQEGQMAMSNRLADTSKKFATQNIGGVTPEEIGQGMVTVSPALRAAGIDPGSQRAADIGAYAAIAINQKRLSPEAVQTYGINTLNSDTSAEGFAGGLNDILTDTHGAKEDANNVLRLYGHTADRFKPLGMEFGDVEKLYLNARKQGLPPEAAMDEVTKAGNAMDRLLGLKDKPNELVDMYEKMTDSDPAVKKVLASRLKYAGSDLNRIEILSEARLKPGGKRVSPEITQLFEDMADKRIDNKTAVRRMAEIQSRMGTDEQEALARTSSGARGIIGLGALAGIDKIHLTQGSGPLQGDISTAALNNADKAATAVRNAIANQPKRDAGRWAERLEQGKKDWDNASPDFLGWKKKLQLNDNLRWGPTSEEGQYFMAYVAEMASLAQEQEDIATGKKKSTPELNARLKAASMTDLAASGMDTVEENPFLALAAGHWLSPADDAHPEGIRHSRAEELAKIKALGLHGWLAQTGVSPSRIHSLKNEIINRKVAEEHSTDAGDAIRAIDRLNYQPTTQPTTRPTTQPAMEQHSSIYNIRQVNYGMSYQNIGAPLQYEDRYG